MMTDTKREALCQALNYHSHAMAHSHVAGSKNPPKMASQEQIVSTAKKFAAFLDGHKR